LDFSSVTKVHKSFQNVRFNRCFLCCRPAKRLFRGEALSLSGTKAENRIKAVSGQESGCFNTGRG
ncbi:hypothetical protein, partial [Bacteroides heparinolyticus]|uniref:hypothetical protein n=1 Tax=Prevotella heparinolytica TaxID=28113 RepID=UPI00359F8165